MKYFVLSCHGWNEFNTREDAEREIKNIYQNKWPPQQCARLIFGEELTPDAACFLEPEHVDSAITGQEPDSPAYAGAPSNGVIVVDAKMVVNSPSPGPKDNPPPVAYIYSPPVRPNPEAIGSACLCSSMMSVVGGAI
ncbi:MAG: hypothetical protein AB7F40_11375 [Victivallaceae bacterium]